MNPEILIDELDKASHRLPAAQVRDVDAFDASNRFFEIECPLK